MSVRVNIEQSEGWHRFENHTLTLTVVDLAGVAVDLAEATGISWRLLRHDTALITKDLEDGLELAESEDDNVVTVEIEATDYVYDAETGTSEVVAGVYRYELWDTEADTLLLYGDAHILPGSEP
jgi:hypothetical protein